MKRSFLPAVLGATVYFQMFRVPGNTITTTIIPTGFVYDVMQDFYHLARLDLQHGALAECWVDESFQKSGALISTQKRRALSIRIPTTGNLIYRNSQVMGTCKPPAWSFRQESLQAGLFLKGGRAGLGVRPHEHKDPTNRDFWIPPHTRP